MGEFIDLTGQKFGKLTVLDRRSPKWFCVCECGGHRHSFSYDLTHGVNKSCGCSSHLPTYGNRCYSIEMIRELLMAENYLLLSTKYINTKQKLKYICPFGHKHVITWGHWNIRGHRCPTCHNKVRSRDKRLDFGFIKSEFEKEGYILLTTEYRNCRQKLEYICPEGHRHNVSWDGWRKGDRCAYCASLRMTGSKHHNWKGGVTSISEIARYMLKHADWPKQIFERDNYTCQRCSGYGGCLNAHHLIPVKQILEYYSIDTMEKVKQCNLLFDINNGLSLCKKCHKWTHSKLNMNKENLYGFYTIRKSYN
ncbi:hypothetical protein LCGC14_0537450 [marine sediment metagenome]|uniref:HNH nuclease domain-containing protein n=1 Tax=marine sediment metagenome TaxID=412755 RepID=A0A0F9RTY8_9ZZZZ